MKNKGLTYVLGLVVLVVWGLIIYRIFLAVSADDNQPLQSSTSLKKEAFNDYTIPKDTTKLLLNYRDPFAAPKPEEKETFPDKSPVQKVVSPVPKRQPVNWNLIKYSGYIHNPGSKKLIAMMNINGKELMMSEGETAEQVKLIKNLKDSVKVSYQGATKFIVLNNKNQ
jgi:hypothetical protein